MRLTGDDWKRHGLYNIPITINGDPVPQGTVTADEDEGFIEAYKRDDNGRPVIEGGEVARQRIYGKITITLPGEK
jgi:hypothetical protein